jgi:glycosyltransferase involved in cell wall biosynthesis
MKPLRVLIETLVDEGLQNAQMSNGREIIARLNPDLFHVTAFHVHHPEKRTEQRPNTRLIQLPERGQTIPLLNAFLLGNHDLVFYVKASPASRAYVKLRGLRGRRGLTIGAIESQANWKQEPTITAQNVRLIELSVLRAHYLFSNSRRVQKSLYAEYGLSSEVVPTGVDTEFFQPRGTHPPNNRPTVLFVGSLRPFKGPKLVIEAARRFPDADFVIVGDGVLLSELRADSANLPNVVMTGPLDAADVRRHFQKADVFFFPSCWEGSPKVLAEAAACGLPVIARSDYEPETILNGKTGILSADEPGLLRALQTLLDDAGLRRSMGQAGRKHILQYDWSVITRRWEDVFVRLTSRSGRRE